MGGTLPVLLGGDGAACDACYRYIELNPVRPGMADEPATYPWSSHSANIGKRTDPLVTPHAQYLALGLEPQTRYRAYAELVREALQPSEITAIRKAISGGLKL